MNWVFARVLTVMIVITAALGWVAPAQPAWAAAYDISVFAGGISSYGNTGDGGPATSAQLEYPIDVAMDSAGSLFIADANSKVVRKVTAAGVISTVAGNGTSGYSGDGGQATSAQFTYPDGVAVDAAGLLYISDSGANVVRKVAANGVITTIAGTGVSGGTGDGGPATSALLDGPTDLAFDSSGNLYVACQWNASVRKIDTGGTITRFAGNGNGGFAGDGGQATSAQVDRPNGVAVDSSGNVFIADRFNNRVRKVATNGVITTVAGTGTAGYSGDGGAATSAKLNEPSRVAVGPDGTLYIADRGSDAVRAVNMQNGIIRTIAGTGTTGFAGNNGPASQAQLQAPFGLLVTPTDDLYIADAGNNVVRLVALGAHSTVSVTGVIDPTLTFTVGGRSSVCNGQSASNFQTGATATAVGLGHATASTIGGGAQDLTVATNAANGFNVYLRTTGTTPNAMRDGSGHAVADVSGTNASPGAAPVAGTPGFGYTSSDVSTAFTSNTWAKLTSTNGAVLVGSAGTVSKSACVGFEFAVAATTAAGVYSANVVYTAVPSF